MKARKINKRGEIEYFLYKSPAKGNDIVYKLANHKAYFFYYSHDFTYWFQCSNKVLPELKKNYIKITTEEAEKMIDKYKGL